MFYTIDIAGMKRDLKLFPVSDDLQIAAFILFGDVEITKHTAQKLLEKAPDFDLIVTAEAKSIPLAYEMAVQAGMNDYIIARKGVKIYMEDVIRASVRSITTENVQTLYLGREEADRIRGRRILIIDDVISTGESLRAIEEIVHQAGGNIVGKMAVLAEGDAFDREDITVLAKLPLFDGDGNVL
ncbi:MAG: phosphoribosyltransferase family protein [Bacillota bacterium]|nr:phosphoribosyltransferase family protein [Bacillota bacterium]